jgi:long-subunit acyl-CoA synthetase (AMP-forming)
MVQVARTDTSGFPDHIKILPFYEVVRQGKKLSNDPSVDPPTNAPTRDDNAIIMFTSGSTGVSSNFNL